MTVDTTNAGATPAGNNISFSSTINNGQTLSLTGGTAGGITLSGAVGGGTALTSLTANANTISVASVKTTGAQSYTGTTTLNGNYLTAGGTFGVTGSALLGGAVAVDTTNAGGTPTGANISFNNTINNAQTLSLTGGTVGGVTLSGAVGGTTALTSLIANASTISVLDVKTSGAQSYTGTTTLNGNYLTASGTFGVKPYANTRGFGSITNRTYAAGDPSWLI